MNIFNSRQEIKIFGQPIFQNHILMIIYFGSIHWDTVIFFQLVLEGVHARQLQDSLLLDVRTVERKIQQGNSLLDFYETKAERIEEQVISN